MAATAIKHMASNFAKLDKFEGMDFRRWQKKMHFLLSSMSVVYVFNTLIPEDDGDDATVEQIRKGAKWDNDDYVCRGLILNGMSDLLFNIYQNVESSKELWDSFARPIYIGLRMSTHNKNSCMFTQHKMNMDEAIQDSDKPKGNNVVGPLVVNMVEHNNSSRDCKGVNVGSKANGSGTKGSVDGSSNSLKGATVHVCKDRCWFKTYESLNNGSIFYIGNESAALVHGHGCVALKLNIINDNIGSAFMSTSKLNDSIIWHARLCHVHFKRMQDMSKDGLIRAFDIDTEKCKTCMLTKITKKPFQNVKRETEVLEMIHSDLCDLHVTPSLENKKYFVIFIDDTSRFCYIYLLHSKDEALDKFKVFKTEVELQQESLIKRFGTDRGGEYMDTLYFNSVGIIHEMTTPYTPQQYGISERKNKVPNKRNKITPYKLWTKRKSNLNYLRVWGYRAVVRLPDLKLKTLGERGIECIFVRYAKHSKAFRFYVIEPNELVSINSINESRDAIFDENIFSSVPRPSQRSLINKTKDIGDSVVPEEVTEEVVAQQPKPYLRKGKRTRTPKNFRTEFQLYLIE
ncbi:zinc finger, CCHC-type containing protein [Tanacetum coccineum]